MKQINVKNIVKVLKVIRENMNLSQAQVAKQAHISTSYYGMIERGERTLSVEQLINLAEVFECNITDILEMVENS